ncbi:hypothetical protein RRG08_035761 [Elysia crispata]|uniref:Uncharacterized protein n=1 Tax=Elysia crispata TaxID=231223 RepID=A0AAE1DJ43_9GAST|nr:hypothetical protein RRG08_035761 [Elysia crispata]
MLFVSKFSVFPIDRMEQLGEKRREIESNSSTRIQQTTKHPISVERSNRIHQPVSNRRPTIQFQARDQIEFVNPDPADDQNRLLDVKSDRNKSTESGTDFSARLTAAASAEDHPDMIPSWSIHLASDAVQVSLSQSRSDAPLIDSLMRRAGRRHATRNKI